ncbi:hypothetical protein CANARDRAFT_29115 [[Candida] arabinofermentans NRRL YB-2248]|uniref:ABC transporter domain-containing protein n=1 Tax=[Candida] arabinofermentans NRRL YB-2248 TaxID=983967 RepID=A0A1E4SYL7_9ASCO|nr:hypothetical protein CANARDRAFT_29115 [[Candida] arabinofermentans NRRL YB-2248]
MDQFFSTSIPSTLCVKGFSADTKVTKFVGSQSNLFATNILSGKLSSKTHAEHVKLLNNLNFIVKPGELCLVLGRPKQSNTLILQKVSQHNEEDRHTILRSNVTSYNQLVFSEEMDHHFPFLSVEKTLRFAMNCKIRDPSINKQAFIEELLQLFEMPHTLKTRVGNDYVRGISGGERRRISIIEALIANGSINCLDNSTRGLDSSTALNFVSTLSKLAKTYDKIFMLTLYQGSQGLYDEFDKVLILYNGYQIYFGDSNKVESYFATYGYAKKNERLSTMEFIDLIIDDSIRFEDKWEVIDPDFKGHIPKTPVEFAEIWLDSEEFASLNRELNHHTTGVQTTDLIRKEKYTQHRYRQFIDCFNRNFSNSLFNTSFIISTLASQVLLAIFSGTLFLNLKMDTLGTFAKGGLAFFILMFYTFVSMSEVSKNFGNTLMTTKQSRHLIFYSPVIETFTSIFTDIPFKLIGILLFVVITYFLSGLVKDAAHFIAFYIFATLGMLSVSQLYHVVAKLAPNLDIANSLSGLFLLWLAMYASYVIPLDQMHPWFKWMAYINPLKYAFESMLLVQLHNVELSCSEADYVIGGSESDWSSGLVNKTIDGICDYTGLRLNYEDLLDEVTTQAGILGDDYLASAFGYFYDEVWRNLGILILFWVFFIGLELLGTGLISTFKSNKITTRAPSLIIYKSKNKYGIETGSGAGGDYSALDEESLLGRGLADEGEFNFQRGGEAYNKPQSHNAPFKWQNVVYTIDNGRVLLNNIDGIVKEGELTALMGSSGAGKTTLLNVLSNRYNSGYVNGFVSMKNQMGYVEQQDLLMGELTVREILVNTALLRRSSDIPDVEKVQYAEKIIKLLELEEYADSQVGYFDNENLTGLTLEQRKKVSLGMELVAKPEVLFVDEITSGLDNQASFKIIKLLKNLTDKEGFIILCTIHQPSISVFEQFDKVCLLAKGGHQVYFGWIDKIVPYFESQCDLKCGGSDNIADYIIDVLVSSNVDWKSIWKSSKNCAELSIELNRIDELHQGSNTDDLGDPFADPQSIQLSTFGSMPSPAPFIQASYNTQFKIILKRSILELIRNKRYIKSKIMLFLVAGLYIGFTFWKISLHSLSSLQLIIFAVFMVLCISSPLIHQIQDRCKMSKELFEFRELKTNTFHWTILPITQFILETPIAIFGSTLSFCCFYFCWGVNSEPWRVFQFWFTYSITFQVYALSFGLFVLYCSPNHLVVGVLDSLLFAVMFVFCGVLQPYYLMPTFWRTIAYYSSPFTYYLNNLVSIMLHDQKLECNYNVGEDNIMDSYDGENVIVSGFEYLPMYAPLGETCDEYLGPWEKASGGYHLNSTEADETIASNLNNFAKSYNLNATQVSEITDDIQSNPQLCLYCKYKTGDEFLKTMNLSYHNIWRDYALFWMFIVLNLILLVAGYWMYVNPMFKRMLNPIKGFFGMIRSLFKSAKISATEGLKRKNSSKYSELGDVHYRTAL